MLGGGSRSVSERTHATVPHLLTGRRDQPNAADEKAGDQLDFLCLVLRNDLVSMQRYVRDCRVQLVSVLELRVLDYLGCSGHRTSERRADGQDEDGGDQDRLAKSISSNDEEALAEHSHEAGGDEIDAESQIYQLQEERSRERGKEPTGLAKTAL